MNNDELQDTFSHFDRDNNGQIDFAEFSQLLDAMNADIEDDARKIGFDSIDSDNNGTIDFDEFRSWWSGQSDN